MAPPYCIGRLETQHCEEAQCRSLTRAFLSSESEQRLPPRYKVTSAPLGRDNALQRSHFSFP
jgi:hypothetical protein